MALKRTAAQMAAEPRIIAFNKLDASLLEVEKLPERKKRVPANAVLPEPADETEKSVAPFTLGLLYDGERLIMDATPQRETWLSAPFGFERSGLFVDQSLSICGGVKVVDYETLNIRVQTTPELHDRLWQIEERVRLKLAAFGTFEWTSALGENADGETYVRVKVVAKAKVDETNFKLKPLVGPMVAGKGVTYLKRLLDDHNDFNFCQVKFTAMGSLWNNFPNKAGMSWTAKVFAAKQTQAATKWPDLYPNDLFD
jgi:hypothetical protein